jgi:type I restriction enzyme R subunit
MNPNTSHAGNASTLCFGPRAGRSSPSTRVERAFAHLTADRRFTEEQQKWLDRIRAHLVVSLSIDREDFDNVPVLLDAGGWKPANRAFTAQLQGFLQALHEGLAA